MDVAGEGKRRERIGPIQSPLARPVSLLLFPTDTCSARVALQPPGVCMTRVSGWARVAGVCAVEGNQQHRLRWVGRRADARAPPVCVM